MKLISLRMFKVRNNTLQAHVNPFTNECKTFEEYSSCVVDAVDSRNSRLRILVSDLEEEESRDYGCTAAAVGPVGDIHTFDWFLTITRESK